MSIYPKSQISVFRRSRPLIWTSFINKCGNIGLSLLPMLLIQRGFSAGESSVVIGLVKAFTLVGTFIGGWFSDRLGLKFSILISFVAAGFGLAGIPFAGTLFWMAVSASLAQLGQSMFQSPARLLITEFVEPHEQPESFAWLRTANNFGQIVSYSMGALFSSFGIPVLIWFDAATSWIAVGAGAKLLPSKSRMAKAHSRPSDGIPRMNLDHWKSFLSITLLLSAYSFFYELFMVGIAGKCQLVYGADGLRIFSQVMVINCILCAFFSVFAARIFVKPEIVFPGGIGFTVLGLIMAAIRIQSMSMLFLGTFVITAGEIMFAVLSQTALLRTIPAGKRRGSIYSLSLILQNCGRILGGALAFSWIVYRANPLPFLLWSGALALLLVFTVRSRMKNLFVLESIHESMREPVATPVIKG